MFHILTITVHAVQAIAAYILEPHPAEAIMHEARRKGIWIQVMGR